MAPNVELRSDLRADLARAGWHLRDGDLVIGDPIKTDRMPQEPLPDLALAVARVTKIGRQLPVVIRELQRRQRGRPPYEVNDEYDLQDLLHALLRVDHADVRPEEWTPSYAGSSARMDFLLKRERVVVEAKKTRSGLGEREIGKQLIVDAAQYAEHPSVDALVCIILDLDREVGNSHGFEDDLAELGSETLNVVAVVAQ